VASASWIPLDYTKSEFINRLDDIVRFQSLTREQLSEIVELQPDIANGCAGLVLSGPATRKCGLAAEAVKRTSLVARPGLGGWTATFAVCPGQKAARPRRCCRGDRA